MPAAVQGSGRYRGALLESQTQERHATETISKETGQRFEQKIMTFQNEFSLPFSIPPEAVFSWQIGVNFRFPETKRRRMPGPHARALTIWLAKTHFHVSSYILIRVGERFKTSGLFRILCVDSLNYNIIRVHSLCTYNDVLYVLSFTAKANWTNRGTENLKSRASIHELRLTHWTQYTARAFCIKSNMGP